MAGIDHELMPAFAVGAAYTYRKFTKQLYRSYTGLTSADYVLDVDNPGTSTVTMEDGYVVGTVPDTLGGGTFREPVYTIASGDVPPGRFWYNRVDYDQTYSGFDFVMTKRLANRWMARASFSYNINKQHNTGPGACVDPTNTIPGLGSDTASPQTAYTAESCFDDTYAATRSTGSGNKSGVFLNSRWQFYLNGLYQLPWNFTVAAAFWGREGYPIMPYVQVTGSDGRVRAVAVRHTNDLRYDDVYNLDLRIEKLIPITATANVTLSADFFNVVNSNTVLQYQNRLERGNSGDVKEIMSPRVLRWGARISF